MLLAKFSLQMMMSVITSQCIGCCMKIVMS